MFLNFLKSLGNRGEVTVSTPPPAGVPPASASGSVVLPPAGDGTPPAVVPPAFSVPDLYKDKPWAKGIDSVDKLWAMNEGAQKLIGERPSGIPGPDATPEELHKFWNSLGRPETADKYQFDYGKNADGTPKAAVDAEWEKNVKQMMYDEGVTAKQASNLQKKFDGLVAETLKKRGIADQQLNTDFDAIGKDIYGAQYDKAVARVSPLLTEFTHPRLQPGLAKLTPEALAIVTNVVDNIRAKFIKSDGAPNVGGGGQPVQTGDSLRSQARELMQSSAYTNSFDLAHEATKTKIAELYRQAALIK